MPRITPTVKQILIGLLVAYVAQLVLENWLDLRVFGWLAMTPGALMPWQLVTYVLVDIGEPTWFLVGLAFIGWSLSILERVLGRPRALQLCLVALLSASIPAWFAGLASADPQPLFGNMPLWYGSFAAMCWIDRRQPMSFFGVLTMPAERWLAVLLGMAVLNFLYGKNVTQLIAGFGAIAGGIGFVHWLRRPRGPRKPPPRKAPRTGGFKVIQGGQDEKRFLH